MPALTPALSARSGSGNPPALMPDYGRRISRPDYYNGFGTGAGFVVPRRGWDERTAAFLGDVRKSPSHAFGFWAGTAPLVVLSALIDLHPIASAALSTDAAMMFGPEDFHFEALEQVRQADGTTTEIINSEGTQALLTLSESLPADTGGFAGLLSTLCRQQVAQGMGCLEAVPGGSGLSDIVTFSPLSVRWLDAYNANGNATPLSPPTLPRDVVNGRIAQQMSWGGAWINLPPETCFVVPWAGSKDNPYGRPHYGAFLGEGLADIAEETDLRDWLHSVAWPRLSVTFPFDKVVQYALDNPDVLIQADGSRLDATLYAQKQFGVFADRFATMKADDILMLPSGGDARSINNSAVAGLEPIYERRVKRVCNALDILPGLLGYTFGGTQAYSEDQTRAQVQKYNARRHWAFTLLGKALNVHLRLLGMPFVARVKAAPLMPADRLQDATAQGLEIANTLQLVKAGFITPEEASVKLTGSGVVDEAKAGAIGNLAPPPAAVMAAPTGQGNPPPAAIRGESPASAP